MLLQWYLERFRKKNIGSASFCLMQIVVLLLLNQLWWIIDTVINKTNALSGAFEDHRQISCFEIHYKRNELY